MTLVPRQTPLMDWNSRDVYHDPVIWWWKLRDRYQVEVRRITAETGLMVIFDHDDNDKCLVERWITFMFNAVTQRPDVSDIADWEDIAKEFLISFHGGKPMGEVKIMSDSHLDEDYAACELKITTSDLEDVCIKVELSQPEGKDEVYFTAVQIHPVTKTLIYAKVTTQL